MRRHPCVALMSVYVLFVSGAAAPQPMHVGCSTAWCLVQRAGALVCDRNDPRELYAARCRVAIRPRREVGLSKRPSEGGSSVLPFAHAFPHEPRTGWRFAHRVTPRRTRAAASRARARGRARRSAASCSRTRRAAEEAIAASVRAFERCACGRATSARPSWRASPPRSRRGRAVRGAHRARGGQAHRATRAPRSRAASPPSRSPSEEATRIGGEVMPLDITAATRGYSGTWVRVPARAGASPSRRSTSRSTSSRTRSRPRSRAAARSCSSRRRRRR